MRLPASLLLAVALAAPFGDAGAFSLAPAEACAGPESARVEGSPALGGHGIDAGGVPAARRYVPPPLAVSSGEGIGGGEAAPRSGGGPRPAGGVGGPPGPAVAATPPTTLPVGATAFLRAFPAHPSTAPPHRT